ncbi:hypothetical protein HDU96_009367 [Phlyctochytrium bullatum]|nr:hypothetical protein HDU96_009367 [Phlyctochytrium bullatum]
MHDKETSTDSRCCLHDTKDTLCKCAAKTGSVRLADELPLWQVQVVRAPAAGLFGFATRTVCAVLAAFVIVSSVSDYLEWDAVGDVSKVPAKVAPVGDGSPFNWVPCEGFAPNSTFFCGTLMVPLNHLNKSDTRQIPIKVIKYPATAEPYLGTILINPGGPGGSGVGMVSSAGPKLSLLSGGNHDILGFDPRGIGESKPVICFRSAAEHTAFTLEHGYGDAPNAPGSRVTLKEFDAWRQIQASGCAKYAGEYLKYISTAYTARDMDLIRENLGEELTNYWGFSYGTILGINYANLFPDRIGKFIIDGVVDPIAFHKNIFVEGAGALVHTDEIFEVFGTECEEAGPKRCALAEVAARASVKAKYGLDDAHIASASSFVRKGKSSISRLVRAFIEDLVENPIPVPDAAAPFVLTRGSAQGVIFGGTYRPTSWPPIAAAFAKAIGDGDAAALAGLLMGPVGVGEDEYFCPLKDSSDGNANPAVTCADMEDQSNTTLEEWEAAAAKTAEISWIGGRSWIYDSFVCRYWPERPAERYTGPWGKSMKNKILVLSNTLDPVTPLESGKTVAKLLGPENGVLLVQEGVGHCSLAQPSLCTIAIVQELFQTGALPEQGKRCVSDYVLFPPPTDGSNGSVKTFTAEESEKLQAASEVVQHVVVKGKRAFGV